MAAAALERYDTLTERVTQIIDRMTGYRLGSYAVSSGYVQQSKSPFDGFGVVVASGSRPLPISKSLREVAIFTVEEARERISSFINGGYVPDSLADLIEYLGEKLLRLESRISPTGAVTNYLVDKKTGIGVPAAQVDPRLSHAALLAMNLRSALREQFGSTSPDRAFDTWESMVMVMENSSSGVAYTVARGEAWYGKCFAIASSDHEANMATIRSARAKGVELILPVRGEGKAASLVPGMPMLVKSRSMKASDVHPALDHAKLAASIGKGMTETFSELASRAGPLPGASGGGTVLSMEEFRSRFARKASPEPQPPEVHDGGIGFGGLVETSKARDLVIRRVEGTAADFYVFDRDLGEELPIAPGSLPEGRYRRENEAGLVEGYTTVSATGAMKHFDINEKVMKPAMAATIESYADRLPKPRPA